MDAKPTMPRAEPTPTHEIIQPKANMKVESRQLEIREFDCFKAEDEVAGVQPPQTLLSKWAAGGPNGASWNATELVCFADVSTNCSHGELRSVLQIGSRQMVARDQPVNERAPQRVRIPVTEQDWRRSLDRPRTPALPYRTAMFVLRAECTCLAPEEFSPGTYSYREVSDVRAFVAGFAAGE